MSLCCPALIINNSGHLSHW